MAIFEKGKLKVLSERDAADLSKASVNQDLSVIGFDTDEKFFYATVDKVLFSNPVTTIKTVLDAHGYVPNLENILSCLDSLAFSVYGRSNAKDTATNDTSDTSLVKITEYFPCIRFELPQKNKVGDTLQSFYDEIAKYESGSNLQRNSSSATIDLAKKNRELAADVKRLQASNKELKEQVSALSHQLSREQKSLSRVSKALDSQQVLPDNAKICRVEHVDLKQRMVKVKCYRKVIEIPTHMLDRVPEFQARCLITFDESDEYPIGIIFFDNEELSSLERRSAELLYVENDIFKARDSMRNEFQIKAVNEMESETIKSLKRGMQVIISVADGYVVRFSVLNSTKAEQFSSKINERFIVYDLARNQLIKLDEGKE